MPLTSAPGAKAVDGALVIGVDGEGQRTPARQGFEALAEQVAAGLIE